MKEKTILMALAILGLMLLMVAPMPAFAWEYANTINGEREKNIYDLLWEQFGPRADHIQIIMYADELAEFTALEQHKIDVTDWPVDSEHYGPWTTLPLNQSIAVVDTGPEFGMYILDMRMNNETRIYRQVGITKYEDLGPNPAYTAPFGNPLADVWLRRAIAACIDRKYVVEQIVSGGELPLLGSPLYTVVNDPPYTGYGHPQLNPTGALAALTYVKSDGSADVALANKFLDEHGYDQIVGGKRTKNGVAFKIIFYIRSDHTYRKLFGEDLVKKLTDPKPSGCQLDVEVKYVTSSGARAEVMSEKKGHMYTGGWGLTIDPDHIYYLFHINNYFHPGRPLNYMYYPGSTEQIEVPYDGWQYNYTNVEGLRIHVDWVTPSYYIDLSDYGKTWKKGDKVWKHPQNYWSWEFMIAPDVPRAIHCARKSQEAMAAYVVGEPVWASRSFTAFHRTYTGPESAYNGQYWMGVVNEKGLGVWSGASFYNMHTANAPFGDGTMTIRWGFRQPTMSLNPIYAEWVWDWYVMNRAYSSLISVDPYAPAYEIRQLAVDWTVGTWDASALGLGICTKLTFHLRHDICWSDGVPITASDVIFTMGGLEVPGSLSSILVSRGLPPPYWYGQIADILSIDASDPWTVEIYLDVYAPVWGRHSMSGFNIVLPEHIWKPIVESGNPLEPWNQPNVCSGPWIIRETKPVQTGESIWLDKNPYHWAYRNPLDIYSLQRPSTTPNVISLGHIHLLDNLKTPKPTTTDVTLDLYITDLYIYTNGPFKENVFPRTVLGGTMNITLWKWTKEPGSCPNDQTKYEKVADISINEAWETELNTPLQKALALGSLGPGYYFVKVDAHISNLKYYDGTSWVTVPPENNIFYCTTITYKEFFIVSSLYDIAGLLFKPCPPATPKYQPIPDLKVDMKDVAMASKAFGSMPGHPRWNTLCDINFDYKVDMKDIAGISKSFGWFG
ncbi:MAG: ABC transporter substrate-binding protein [Nitrososphaerota archaeon]